MLTMNKLKVYINEKGELVGHTWYCPGCQTTHFLKKDTWEVKNPYRPTVSPSYNLINRCHCIITDGVVHYLGDSRHEFANKLVNMIPVCLWPREKRIEIVEGVAVDRPLTKLESIVSRFKRAAISVVMSTRPAVATWKPYVWKPVDTWGSSDRKDLNEWDEWDYWKYRD